MSDLKILVAANLVDAATLVKAIAAAKAEDLAAEILVVTKERDDALEVNEELNKNVSSLTTELQKAKSKTAAVTPEAFPTFKSGEDVYEVVLGSCYINGILKTDKEIAASIELQEFLIKIKSEVIRKK